MSGYISAESDRYQLNEVTGGVKKQPVKLLSSWKIIVGIVCYIVLGEVIKELIIFEMIEPMLESRYPEEEQLEQITELLEYILLSMLLIPISIFFVVLPVNKTNRQLIHQMQEIQLTQSRLLQQEKLASIGHLAAGVAHEINNPISFVSSNVNQLKASFDALTEYHQILENHCPKQVLEELTPKKRELDIGFVCEDLPELIKDCQEGTMRVKEIIENLKDFARVDDTCKFTEFNINDAVQSTLKIVRSEFKDHCKVSLSLESSATLTADRGQINQVIANLIINAAHATKDLQRRGEIRISTSDDDQHTNLIIRDNGIGIAKNLQDKVYDPFFTTKPVGQGTGLGLNIAYDIIVNKHNGLITVESEPDCFTQFRIRIPQNSRLI